MDPELIAGEHASSFVLYHPPKMCFPRWRTNGVSVFLPHLVVMSNHALRWPNVSMI